MSKRKAERPSRKAVTVAASGGGVGFAQPLWISLALFAVTLAVFAPVRGFDFIDYDDTEYITRNWHVLTGLTWNNVHWAFTTGYLGNWLPLTWLSHMLDVQWFGKGAAAPHLGNAFIHALNGVLVFQLLWRMTRGLWRSTLAAALFALHPLRVESVAWACERRDVLSVFFGLLALIAYARHAERKASNIRWYGVSLLLFAFSLMSKPMLVTFPFALLLLDYWPLGRITIHDSRFTKGDLMRTSRVVWEKVPFLVLGVIFSILTVKLQAAAGAVSSLGRLPLSARVENALVSYARYIGKFFWPTDLALPYLHAGRWPAGQVALAVMLIVGLCVLGVWFARRQPFMVVGWLWFLGILVPVIGIIQAGPQAMADRFVYLPALGISVMVVWGLGGCVTRWRVPKALVAGGTAVILVALTLRTMDQLKYWHDTGTLFTHTLAVEPDNYTAMNSLGVFTAAHGQGDEAVEYYRRALKSNPVYAQAMNNLGNLLAARRQYPEAIEVFEQSLNITSNQPEAYVNLGSALAAVGRTEEAVAQFKAALLVQPDDPDALNNLGSTLAMKGDFAGSIAQLRRVTQLRPDDADSHFNLGNALALGGQLEGAVAEFRETLRLQPWHPRALINLGSALGMQGRWQEAAECYRAMLKVAPRDSVAHGSLGHALGQMGQPEEAQTELEQALQINPDNVEANFYLGSLLAKLGRRDEAVAHLMHAVQLRPGYGEARQTLREMGIPVTQ